MTDSMRSSFELTDVDLAEQLCRAALGAGMQARKQSGATAVTVIIDHLSSERTKVDAMVDALDPSATRTSSVNRG
jgi:hypothetical protein